MTQQSNCFTWCYIWEFTVKDGANAEFEKYYGPEGDWAEFFQQGSGYLKTELIRDNLDPQRYLTLDYWLSHDHFLEFKKAYAAEYQSLDEHCEGLTLKESQRGEFTRVP